MFTAFATNWQTRGCHKGSKWAEYTSHKHTHTQRERCIKICRANENSKQQQQRREQQIRLRLLSVCGCVRCCWRYQKLWATKKKERSKEREQIQTHTHRCIYISIFFLYGEEIKRVMKKDTSNLPRATWAQRKLTLKRITARQPPLSSLLLLPLSLTVKFARLTVGRLGHIQCCPGGGFFFFFFCCFCLRAHDYFWRPGKKSKIFSWLRPAICHCFPFAFCALSLLFLPPPFWFALCLLLQQLANWNLHFD